FGTTHEGGKLSPPVYDAVRRERPGMTSRSDVWWEERHLRLEEDEKDAPRRFVVLEADGEPQAYAVYRTRFSFEEGLPASRLIVREALGATPAATAAIWRFVLDVDWMSVVEVSLAPPDHPLFLLLALPRRARYRMGGGLWVAILGLPLAPPMRPLRLNPPSPKSPRSSCVASLAASAMGNLSSHASPSASPP